MRLQLNNISDSIASENLAHALDRLDANLREVARGLRPVHPDIWFAIGLRSLDVGLLSFRQQAPAAQVQMYLAQAGQYLLRYFAECPMPTVGEDRNPWQFEQVINLVVSFCERINRSAVAAIPRAQYDTRDNRDAKAMVDYLDLVKGYLVGHTPTHAKMQQLEDSCTSDSASKESVVALRAKLRGLRGVMTLEAESWKQSIREVVDAHEWEARKGKYRQRVEGLISLPALMTAKLGIEVGLVCDVRSPYLPLNLLTERA